MAGRQSAKRKRKRRRERVQAPSPPAAEAAPRRSKDDIARERLVPLEQGERPLVVTIAAVIATGMAASTIVLFALGVEVQDAEARNAGSLGFQTLLALLIVIWSLLLMKAETALGAVLALSIIALAGTMFWFLVKALARIQMPERRPPA